MTVTLEPAVFRNGIAVAALARVTLWHAGLAGGVAIAGSKQPVAVLVQDAATLRGFDMAGRALSVAQVEALLPDAPRAMSAVWQAHHDAASAAFSGDSG